MKRKKRQAFEQIFCRISSRKWKWCPQWCNWSSTWFYEYHMCDTHANVVELRLHSFFFFTMPFPLRLFLQLKCSEPNHMLTLKSAWTFCISRIWILQQITCFQLTPLTFIANLASWTRCISSNNLLAMAATCSLNKSHESRPTLRLHTK